MGNNKGSQTKKPTTRIKSGPPPRNRTKNPPKAVAYLRNIGDGEPSYFSGAVCG